MKYIQYNAIIIVKRAAKVTAGGLFPEKGVLPMVTYDELFQFVIMLCAVAGIAYRTAKKK